MLKKPENFLQRKGGEMPNQKNSSKKVINPAFSSLKPQTIKEHIQDLKDKIYAGFPLDVFPHRIKGMINATNEALNFPLEYTSCACLFAISMAIGKNIKITPREGWDENGSLWVCLVGRAGATKSPVLKYMLKPIKSLEKKAYRLFQDQLAEYKALSKDEKSAHSEPIPVNYYTQDSSPEALLELHAQNPRGLAYMCDELVSWWMNLNRYNTNSEGIFLTGWDGGGMKVNRIQRDPIFLDEMYIPIIGGTQPSKLISLAKDGRDSSGLMARILFCFPENTTKGKWNNISLSKNHEVYWEYVVTKIIEFSSKEPLKLKPSKEAYKLLEKWQHENATLVDLHGEGTLAEMFNKAERQCVRLALILQVLYWACGEDGLNQISTRAVNGAIALVECFKKQADKVCEVIYDGNPLDRLPKKKRDFYNALPDEFVSQDGIQLAESLGISRSSYYRMLNKEGLFSKSNHNSYIKTA